MIRRCSGQRASRDNTGSLVSYCFRVLDSETAINRQISLELCASNIYLSMSCYFDSDDVALKNFAKYFLHQSHEEREHAEKLMKLQNN
ncbi:hypothetical protein H8959_012020 [Pygathrix nigripes]